MCICLRCFNTYLYMFDGKFVIYYDKEKDKGKNVFEEIQNKSKNLIQNI